MSGMIGAGGATDTLLNLINLLSDPAGAKARVEELKEATDQQAEAAQNAATAERQVRQAQDDLQALRKKFDADITAYENDKQQFKARQDEVNAAAAAREQALAAAEIDLRERQAAFEHDYRERSLTLRDQETTMQRRERDASAHERALRDLETQLTKKERALRAALAG